MPKRKKGITEKTFIILSQEAIESLDIETARTTYKSIKSNTNPIYSSYKQIEKALSDKVAINEQIEELEEDIDDNPSDDDLINELNDILSATSTIILIRDLEKAFNVEPKSFIQISDSIVKINDYVIDPINKNNENISKNTIQNNDNNNEDDTSETSEDEQKKSISDSTNTPPLKPNKKSISKDINDSETEIKPKKKSISKNKKSKLKTKLKTKTKTKKNKLSVSDSDGEYDNLAVYQSTVYNNNQMILSKNKTKSKRKKSKTPKKNRNKSKTKTKTKSKTKSYSTTRLSIGYDGDSDHDNMFKHSHEKVIKNVTANSKSWDRDWDKINKQRQEIKRLKAKRKHSNSLKIRNQKSTKKIYTNPHEKKGKVTRADSKKWDRDWDKINKQREEIKKLKEKRKKEKEKGMLRRRTYSFKHPHDK